SKSIAAPSPGPVGACTSPSLPTVMSSARPYFCIASGSCTSKNSVLRIAMMNLVIHAKRLGEVRGLDQGGNAALDRDIAAQHVGGALRDPRDVGVEPADRVFGGEDRDRQLLFQLDVVVDVLVVQRVLVPVEPHLLD